MLWLSQWGLAVAGERMRRVLAAAIMLALIVSVSACQVRPLYLTADGTAAITPDLQSIEITIDSREDDARQALMRELVFALRDGGSLLEERYALSILLTKRTQRVAVEEFEDVPNAFFVELVATFTLFDNQTRRTLLTGTSFSNSSYDFSSQRFANIRAERDADQRAAGVIALDIRTRLASYFARIADTTRPAQ